MPVFQYTALNKLGRHERGAIQADSSAEARRKLRESNVHVLDLAADGASSPDPTAVHQPVRDSRRIKNREVAATTRQLATLLHAGMPLVKALTALQEQLAGQPLAPVVSQVRSQVNEGSSLAAALSNYPKVFSELYVNMVRAGETAGALEQVLRKLADFLEKRVHLVNKVRAALAYPIFMSFVGVAVILFLLSFVIPSIAKLFLEMHRALPLPTVLLIRISGFLRSYLLVILAGAGALGIALRVWVQTEAGRTAWDGLKLKMPLFGQLFLKISISRFARTLGVLLASGVPILDALGIVRNVVGNRVISGVIDKARDAVSHGDSIANPLRHSGIFPPIVFHMVEVGERSGSVEEGLINVADAFDDEIESLVTGLTSLLEPLMIIIMGVIVGFIVLAILLPIFDINQAIS